MKLLLLGMDYIQKKKKSHGNLQTTQAVAKAVGCSLKTGGEAPLLKKTSTQLTEHGGIKLVPT